MNDTLIVIPTYKEIESLPVTLAGVLRCAPGVDVLIADDNSPDGTGQLAADLARENPRVHVLHRPGKEGLGPAYLAGFAWARDHGYTWVGEFDADGSHLPEHLPRLLHAARGTTRPDLVIGARWIAGGKVEGWARHRQWLSRGGNSYIRLLLGMPVTEATAGMRIYRLDFLEKLDPEYIESKGYSFQIEMTWRSYRAGARIVEVPITFRERAAGASKMSQKIIVEALAKVARMAWRERLFSGITSGRKTPPTTERTGL